MNCEEISRLISQEIDQPLTFMQRVRLRFHLLFCRQCPVFRAYIRRLQNRSTEIEAADLSDFPQLSESVKKEIVQELNQRVQEFRQ